MCRGWHENEKTNSRKTDHKMSTSGQIFVGAAGAWGAGVSFLARSFFFFSSEEMVATGRYSPSPCSRPCRCILRTSTNTKNLARAGDCDALRATHAAHRNRNRASMRRKGHTNERQGKLVSIPPRRRRRRLQKAPPNFRMTPLVMIYYNPVYCRLWPQCVLFAGLRV